MALYYCFGRSPMALIYVMIYPWHWSSTNAGLATDSVNLLWLSLTVYMLALVLYLGKQMSTMQQNLTQKTSIKLKTI